jgi:hypothetical protein
MIISDEALPLLSAESVRDRLAGLRGRQGIDTSVAQLTDIIDEVTAIAELFLSEYRLRDSVVVESAPAGSMGITLSIRPVRSITSVTFGGVASAFTADESVIRFAAPVTGEALVTYSAGVSELKRRAAAATLRRVVTRVFTNPQNAQQPPTPAPGASWTPSPDAVRDGLTFGDRNELKRLLPKWGAV